MLIDKNCNIWLAGSRTACQSENLFDNFCCLTWILTCNICCEIVRWFSSFYINWSRPGDAYMCTTPSYYLGQCWLFVDRILWKFESQYNISLKKMNLDVYGNFANITENILICAASVKSSCDFYDGFCVNQITVIIFIFCTIQIQSLQDESMLYTHLYGSESLNAYFTESPWSFKTRLCSLLSFLC